LSPKPLLTGNLAAEFSASWPCREAVGREIVLGRITGTVYKMPPRRYEHLADRKSREWSGTPRGKRSYCET
jgi:hypothetical protein